MRRRVSLKLAAIFATASLLSAASYAKPPEPVAVPTPKGYGRPLPPPVEASYPASDGHVLRCKTSALDECVVHGLALFYQYDLKIVPQLADFLAKYAKNGIVSHLDGTAAASPTDYAINMLKFACYDASMSVIIDAALTNRSKDIHPTGRTAEFDGMRASDGLSRLENQFLWKNKIEFQKEQEIVSNGKPIQAFHFYEVVADLSGGIRQSCDPYKYQNCDGTVVEGKERRVSAASLSLPFSPNLTNEFVRDQMREGKLPLVGFYRYSPELHFDRDTGVLTVGFVLVNMHKVPFAGFQPGRWPLTIADVGDGQMHRVSIGTDIRDLKFAPKDAADAAKVKSVKFFLPKGITSEKTPFLQYENGGDQVEPNPTVYFIENYDYLFVPNVNAP